MKRLFALACLLAGMIQVNAQENFTLNVHIDNLIKGDKFFLCYQNVPGSIKIDSAEVVGNNFTYKGSTVRPQRAFMFLAPANSGFGRGLNSMVGTPVYLEKGVINVSANQNLRTNLHVGGTRLNDELQAFNATTTPFDEQYKKAYEEARQAYWKGDSATMKKASMTLSTITKNKEAAEFNFFKTHLDSEIALNWLERKYNIVQEKSEAEKLFAQMSDRIKNSFAGKRYQAKLNATQAIEVNVMAPDFKAADKNGKEIALSSLRGKYVLLDFWASWCGPCRKENPNVLKAYNAYKDKNFTVLGFSLDERKDAWTKAVEADKMPWTQISDLKAWNSPIAAKYGVQAIPSNFLIDPNGKIIATNLRGAKLEAELAKVLK